ncbi:hypothetical protein SAMN04487906_0925 [Zhouia amylolytica]|uniref:Uncharacterized protein n=1 Tax=Zhouia amylolytica TaxID=376730 RepID=A0A1I6QW87_9FLAO|nr:hypothetical protein SAMN04487906_0925 [Zhouia amylolytica]
MQISAAVLSVINYKLQRSKSNKLLAVFLWVVVIIELLAMIPYYFYYYPELHVFKLLLTIIDQRILKSPIWLFNVFKPLWYMFYLTYIILLISKIRLKSWVRLLLIIFTIISLLEIVMKWNLLLKEWLPITRIVGAMLFFIAATMYYLEVLNSKIILNFHKKIDFWVITSALLYNLSTVPIFIFSNQLNFSHPIYDNILLFSNITIYGSLIVGFLINARVQKGEKAPLS